LLPGKIPGAAKVAVNCLRGKEEGLKIFALLVVGWEEQVEKKRKPRSIQKAPCRRGGNAKRNLGRREKSLWTENSISQNSVKELQFQELIGYGSPKRPLDKGRSSPP